MTPLLFAALAVAGGVGAVARFALDGLIGSRLHVAFPWATFMINVSGSLALGLVTALAAGHLLPQELALVLGTGFLGGYTTFSTNSQETVRLLRERRYAMSLANALGTLVVCSVAAAMGYWLAMAL